MHRLLFAAVTGVLVTSLAEAQPVPGRDLLDFPLGAIAEPAALATQSAVGLWNPAAASLSRDVRVRLTATALNAGADQGVSAVLLGGVGRVASGTFVGLSVARATVSDLVHTETDPQTVGSIAYSTMLTSLSMARRIVPHLTVGLAARLRSGRIDLQHGQTIGLDGGIVADALGRVDGRVAIASFLARPGSDRGDRPVTLAAADLRVWGNAIEREARMGFAWQQARSGTKESFAFLSGRMGQVEGRAGAAKLAALSDSRWVTRLGVGLHYARFTVGVAREDAGSRSQPLYQFSIGSIVK